MKKKFFQEPTTAQIMEYSSIREFSTNLITNIATLTKNEAGIIKADLIPEELKQIFMKHGNDVKLQRFDSLEEIINNRETPVQLRKKAFNEINNKPYSKYSSIPIIGNDRRIRNVSLYEDKEGIKIYCYSDINSLDGKTIYSHSTLEHRGFRPFISLKAYDNAKRVEKDGAEIIVRVPSRRKNKLRYEFKFSSVPIIDTPRKFGLAFSIVTDHNCKSKRYKIRYTYLEDREGSRVFHFCAHEIAAYFAIINYYLSQEKNIIPLQMNPFAIPNQETIHFNNILDNNCLIQTSDDSKPRKLHVDEKEVLNWGLVYKLGYDNTFDKTFFTTEKLRDYVWN